MAVIRVSVFLSKKFTLTSKRKDGVSKSFMEIIFSGAFSQDGIIGANQLLKKLCTFAKKRGARDTTLNWLEEQRNRGEFKAYTLSYHIIIC